MKIEITDPFLGTRTLDDGYLAMIKDQLRLLESFRDDGRVPSKELLEDIKVYEYIIQHPQAEQKATEYADAMDAERTRTKSFGVSKIMIAKKLGWFQ